MTGDIITSEQTCSEDAKDSSGGVYEGKLKQAGIQVIKEYYYHIQNEKCKRLDRSHLVLTTIVKLYISLHGLLLL